MRLRVSNFPYLLVCIPLLGGPEVGFMAVFGQFDSALHPVQHRTQTHVGEGSAGVTERPVPLGGASYVANPWMDLQEMPLSTGSNAAPRNFALVGEGDAWPAGGASRFPDAAAVPIVTQERAGAMNAAVASSLKSNNEAVAPIANRPRTKIARRERFWAAQVLLGAIVASAFNVWLLSQACALILVGGLGALSFGDLVITFIATVWQRDIIEHRHVLAFAWKLLTDQVEPEALASHEAEQDEELRQAIRNAQLGMRFVSALHSLALEERVAERSGAATQRPDAADKTKGSENELLKTSDDAAQRANAEQLVDEPDMAADADLPDTMANEQESETLTKAQDLI